MIPKYTPMAETCLIWDFRYPPCIAKVARVTQYCFQQQTLWNKYWVIRMYLYPCVCLATSQVWMTKRICPWTAI